MAYTRASATPISWTPTSDGWKRSSGIANLSLFIRIIYKKKIWIQRVINEMMTTDIPKGTTFNSEIYKDEKCFKLDHFTFNFWFRSWVKDYYKSFFQQLLFGCSISQIGPRGEKGCKDFKEVWYDLDIWHRNLTKGYETPLTYKQSFSEVWTRLSILKRIYGPDKVIFA